MPPSHDPPTRPRYTSPTFKINSQYLDQRRFPLCDITTTPATGLGFGLWSIPVYLRTTTRRYLLLLLSLPLCCWFCFSVVVETRSIYVCRSIRATKSPINNISFKYFTNPWKWVYKICILVDSSGDNDKYH